MKTFFIRIAASPLPEDIEVVHSAISYQSNTNAAEEPMPLPIGNGNEWKPDTYSGNYCMRSVNVGRLGQQRAFIG